MGALALAALMGVMAVTGLYDITLVGAPPAWTGLALALQAAVTEELWMRALLLRMLWRAFGPVPAFAVAAVVFGAVVFAAVVFGALHLANPEPTPSLGSLWPSPD
jgi:membrane protease YdiL (CAAX protease family)